MVGGLTIIEVIRDVLRRFVTTRPKAAMTQTRQLTKNAVLGKVVFKGKSFSWHNVMRMIYDKNTRIHE